MTSHSNPDPASAVFGSTSHEVATFFGHFAPSSAHKGPVGKCLGTRGTPFVGFMDKNIVADSMINHYQSINSTTPHEDFSFEELRLADYEHMRSTGNTRACFPEQSSLGSPHLQLPHKNVATIRLPPASAATFGPFGSNEAVPESEKTAKPVDTNIRIALLEQELRLCQVQLEEATRINTELTKSRQMEAERVLILTQELTHCERRTAKAEIAVEHLSELNVQIWTKVKQLEEPDQRISTLEKEIKRANDTAEMRLSLLKAEKQILSQDNEKLRLKLENAMDTILALSSLQGSASPNKKYGVAGQGSQTAGAKDPNQSLIDLLGDCLSPTKKVVTEEQTITLLNESDDPDDGNLIPQGERPQYSSDPFDSDFSNSSYIVRFKGVRDMTKHGRIIDTPSPSISPRANSLSPTPEESSKINPSPVCPVDSRTNVERTPDQQSTPDEPSSAFESDNSNHEYASPTNPSPSEDAFYKKCVVPTTEVHSRSEWLKHGTTFTLNVSAYSHPSPHMPHEHPKPKKSIETLPSEKSKQILTSSKLKEPPILESLQFRPAAGDTDANRTILISNLPPEVTLSQLLGKVCGGAIVDAQLFNTISITGTYSAMVTYLDGYAAGAYQRRTGYNPIIFHGLTAKVSLLTPTWPLSPDRRKYIVDCWQTRCLEVHDFPNDVSPTMLHSDLQTCPNIKATWLIFRHLSKRQILTLHFSSIEHASRAYAVLSRSRRYKDSSPSFVPDPCARPLEYSDDPVKTIPVETLADSASDPHAGMTWENLFYQRAYKQLDGIRYRPRHQYSNLERRNFRVSWE